jgi:hypothetical protein
MNCDRVSRADRALAVLQESRDRQKPPLEKLWPRGAGWVALPELQEVAGAQHGARLSELRERGFDIENQMLTRPEDGCRLSWYRLAPLVPPEKKPFASEPESLFELGHRDRSYLA